MCCSLWLESVAKFLNLAADVLYVDGVLFYFLILWFQWDQWDFLLIRWRLKKSEFERDKRSRIKDSCFSLSALRHPPSDFWTEPNLLQHRHRVGLWMQDLCHRGLLSPAAHQPRTGTRLLQCTGLWRHCTDVQWAWLNASKCWLAAASQSSLCFLQLWSARLFVYKHLQSCQSIMDEELDLSHGTDTVLKNDFKFIKTAYCCTNCSS